MICHAPPMVGEQYPLRHMEYIGFYDGKPRSYCARCGAWLEEPRPWHKKPPEDEG